MIPGLIHIMVGGPEFDIQVQGKVYHFEMHRYCGPVWLNKRGDPYAYQPRKFLHAASLWAQQGQKVENGLCVWHHEPEMITRHMYGRNYEFLGYKPAVRGI